MTAVKSSVFIMLIYIYLSGVNSIVHDLYPTLESGYLEQAQVGFSDMIKIHSGIIPCIIFCYAGVFVGDDFVTQC